MNGENDWQKNGRKLHCYQLFTILGTIIMLYREKTPMAKKATVKRQWFIFDAAGKTLGRFASEVAKVLRGKHKPTYTAYEDMGDGVIIINAEKIKVTGNKQAQKVYRHHTGHPGGMVETPYSAMEAKKPTYIIQHAVEGMMPATRIAERQSERLKIFVGAEHGMEAQQPIKVNI